MSHKFQKRSTWKLAGRIIPGAKRRGTIPCANLIGTISLRRNVSKSCFDIHTRDDFPADTISISDGSYSWGFSYPRRFNRVAATFDRPFSLISAM